MNKQQQKALRKLNNIMDDLRDLSDRANEIQREHFPTESSLCEAYRVFDFGWSCNPYDKTFEKFLENIEQEIDEQEIEYNDD